MQRTIVTAGKAAAAGAAMLWGDLHPLVQLLLMLMAFDIASGMLAAFVRKELSSDVSFRGMAKKAMALLLVGAATVVEPHAGGVPLGAGVAGFYAASELLSVVENAAEIGLPVPRVLRDALAKLGGPQEG